MGCVRRRSGFTLIEMLIVIAIIGILVGLLLPVLAKAKMAAKIANTKANIQLLHSACDSYRQAIGLYPNKPGGNTNINDNGSGISPQYLQSTCKAYAGGGTPSDGSTEDNSDLMKTLVNMHFFDVAKASLDGSTGWKLLDGFGTPIIARFLILPTKKPDGSPYAPLDANGNSEPNFSLLEKAYIWSYGPDKIQGVYTNNAAGYTNLGVASYYDTTEAAFLETVITPPVDDITNWR